MINFARQPEAAVLYFLAEVSHSWFDVLRVEIPNSLESIGGDQDI